MPSKAKRVAAAQGRSWVAVAAHQRNSAGPMGGRPAENHKRGRQQFKLDLKRGDYDG